MCSTVITELYRVEHYAKEQRLSEASHFELRKLGAGQIRNRFKAWLDAEAGCHLPKRPLGVAIRTRSANGPSLACSSTTRAYLSTTTPPSVRSAGSHSAGTTTCSSATSRRVEA
ncbi:MAG: hypothetical protein BGO98_02020 [Myxococcales bacterium 68-20]|nr:MAG: hypothetical protein BGO98_02020 [Myxococcales bacterium 68-20]